MISKAATEIVVLNLRTYFHGNICKSANYWNYLDLKTSYLNNVLHSKYLNSY